MPQHMQQKQNEKPTNYSQNQLYVYCDINVLYNRFEHFAFDGHHEHLYHSMSSVLKKKVFGNDYQNFSKDLNNSEYHIMNFEVHANLLDDLDESMKNKIISNYEHNQSMKKIVYIRHAHIKINKKTESFLTAEDSFKYEKARDMNIVPLCILIDASEHVKPTIKRKRQQQQTGQSKRSKKE